MRAGTVKGKKKGTQSAQVAASAPVVPEASPLDPNVSSEQLDLFDDGSPKQGRLL